MTQPRRHSLAEAITNTIAGLVVSFAIQLIIYPTLRIPVTIGQNVLITAVFTVASIGRGYIVRRIFNGLRP